MTTATQQTTILEGASPVEIVEHFRSLQAATEKIADEWELVLGKRESQFGGEPCPDVPVNFDGLYAVAEKADALATWVGETIRWMRVNCSRSASMVANDTSIAHIGGGTFRPYTFGDKQELAAVIAHAEQQRGMRYADEANDDFSPVYYDCPPLQRSSLRVTESSLRVAASSFGVMASLFQRVVDGEIRYVR
jgi:hypothetical protein